MPSKIKEPRHTVDIRAPHLEHGAQLVSLLLKMALLRLAGRDLPQTRGLELVAFGAQGGALAFRVRRDGEQLGGTALRLFLKSWQ